MDVSRNTLSFETILTLAEREAGAYGLGGDGLRQRVKSMIDAINARGPYEPYQIEAMSRQLQRLLVTRLRLAADRERYPKIASEEIVRPIFVIGFARSGTTLLHSLLAEDPEVLKPQSWHSFSPSPPPGAMPVVSGRIAYAQRMIEQWMDFCPGQRPMHPYIDKGAYQLVEDNEVFTLDFRNVQPYHMYRVPTLHPSMVILGEDHEGAFRFHRELLQHLQWNTGKTRWACKDPGHQFNLETLLKVYPDALCVWPHRPLSEIYASQVSLRATIFDTISGKANDWSSFAREYAQHQRNTIDRLIANEMIDDPRILHMPFRELSADPIAAVKKVYKRHGLDVTPDFEKRLGGWLADPENQVDRYGRYPYSYEAFGLDKAWIQELFAGYSKRFGLEQ